MNKRYGKLVALATGTALICFASASAVAGSGPAGTYTLEQMVKEQQRQLDTQASEIAELKEQLKAILGATRQNQEALTAKADKKEIENLKVDKMVTSSNKNVDLNLYGQINRAVLWADNGDSSRTYFVDNIFSSTRMGLNAQAGINDDLTIGAKIEYEITSNRSNRVNQFDHSLRADFNHRHTFVSLDSQKFGKISLGHTHSASDGTAEMDLSGTKVISYSAVNFFAGGQIWNDSSDSPSLFDPGDDIHLLEGEVRENIESLHVDQTMRNMDGLSRRDLVRYDTPSLGGFTLAGSAIEDGAFDLAARYERKFDDFTIVGALAWATPGDLLEFLVRWDNQYDGSISFLHSSGFNITLAGGQQDFDEQITSDDPSYWYGKLGYRADLFSSGESAFAIDYGQWQNFAADGDQADSIGLAFVQIVKDWGTDFYISYRWYGLDRDNADFDDINGVMAGARVKF